MSPYEMLRARKLGYSDDFLAYIYAKQFSKAPPIVEHEYTGAVPVTITADGAPLLDYLISGNMEQSGTPSPDNPIMPQGTGERTANLFDSNLLVDGYHLSPQTGLPVSYQSRIASLQPIKISATDAYLSFTKIGIGNIKAMYSVLDDDDTLIRRVTSIDTGAYLDLSGGSKLYIAFYDSSTSSTITTANVSNIMLNLGSTALPYEPYGYKIPISCGGTTTPVYFGEVQTERKIKKLAFDGTESGWRKSSTFFFNQELSPDYLRANGSITCMCSHYSAYQQVGSGANVPEGYCSLYYSLEVQRFYIKDSNFATLEDFTTYLAQQYAAGTPVTVWYVLATEETAVVNEPLMRIGDYADTVSKAQAGATIPTSNGSTTIDVDTTVKPSEVYIKYKGV